MFCQNRKVVETVGVLILIAIVLCMMLLSPPDRKPTQTSSLPETEIANLRNKVKNLETENTRLAQENETMLLIVEEERKNRSKYNKLLGEHNELKLQHQDLGLELQQSMEIWQKAAANCRK